MVTYTYYIGGKLLHLWPQHCSLCPTHDLEGSLYDANKLIEKQQEEIRTLMNQFKLLEEGKIKMVSVANDDLHRQQAFTVDSYNIFHSQHTAFITFLIEANTTRGLAETIAARWRQRYR